MRRQVRPFVTEVRATGRRPKDAAFSATRPERDAPRDTDQPRATFAAGHHESAPGSYEAAMKAADALFSPPRADAQPAGAAQREMLASTSVTALDDASSVANGAQARSTVDADAVFAPIAQTTSHNGRDLPESGGRILQAIETRADDDDSSEALEAEQAPKRRGRKPGSKNRPKTPAYDHVADAAFAPKASGRPSRVPDDLDVGARTAALVALLAEPAAPVAPTPAPRPAPLLASNKPRERFAWVRTKLRPGEKWKRRLPKVAW